MKYIFKKYFVFLYQTNIKLHFKMSLEAQLSCFLEMKNIFHMKKFYAMNQESVAQT